MNTNTQALIDVIRAGDFDKVKVAIEQGNIEYRPQYQKSDTILHKSLQRGNNNGITELLIAKIGERDDCKELIDWRGENLNRAIHLAVKNGHPKIVEMLLDRDADVNVENTNQKGRQIPLHIAIIKASKSGAKDDFLQIIQQLLIWC